LNEEVYKYTHDNYSGITTFGTRNLMLNGV